MPWRYFTQRFAVSFQSSNAEHCVFNTAKHCVKYIRSSKAGYLGQVGQLQPAFFFLGYFLFQGLQAGTPGGELLW